MSEDLKGLPLLMKYQTKYGKRGSDSKVSWILRKRTINIACMVVESVSNLDFADFELALYFRCDDRKMQKILKTFESQMEEAALNPEAFIANLDRFYQKNGCYIEENNLFRDFYDFCKLLEQQRRLKISQGHKKIFDAYLSFLMQQNCYFGRTHIEDSVVGITEKGELLFQKNPNPYSDLACYDLEKNYKAEIMGKRELTDELLRKVYKTYGYNIHGIADVERLEAVAKTYDNNIFTMIPYISEDTRDMIIEREYQHYKTEFPRQWKSTDVYKDNLKRRNYMLPSSGVTAEYVNAGDFRKILFKEVLYNDEIILLYRVITYDNGEFSGYFQTKKQIFFSIFEATNRADWHDALENFILENYMVLTCDYVIDRKKNYALNQVEILENTFHFPYQPLVKYTYRNKAIKKPDGKSITRHYVKENYQEEVRTRLGYIRNLPENQRASQEATQYAADLGLALPDGKTFVRAHEYRVYRKIYSNNIGCEE